tara:strand:- start:283 stop:1209 length:927 start_codon:yes stop_codon:yes gene_type:complete
MTDSNKVTFDADAIFNKDIHEPLLAYREELFGKFARQITRLLESRKPKKVSSRKGLLNTRTLFKHNFDDNVFYKNTQIPSSDTTIVFLIDNSGSMSSYGKNNWSSLDDCNAVVSAFCKANKVCLNNEIKTEVFYKSTPCRDMSGFVKGQVPILTRVFSNVKNDTNWDKILKVDTTAPVRHGKHATGSLTPEFLLLPALTEWMRTNIVTKNVVVVNLTDGSVQHSFTQDMGVEGSRGRSFYATDNDTKTLRIKYLRAIPHITMFLGARDWMKEDLIRVYGEHNSMFVEDETFVSEFFKLLTEMVAENVG